MRKFWIVMLAVGLMMAFTVPAFAVGGTDVQFSGTYRVRGWYDDNISLLKANEPGGLGASSVNKGQAFYDNRLRIETTFKVAEGLKLVTRFDALERKWGQQANGNLPSNGTNTGTFTKVNDSVSFERAYVSFTTGLGTFNVGYQDWARFGTQFADSDSTYPGIKYINVFGPLTVLAGTEKRSESVYLYNNPTGGANTQANSNMAYNSGYVDVDSDNYDLGGILKFKGGEAGFLFEYLNDRGHSQYQATGGSQAWQGPQPYRTTVQLYDGYVKYKVGPVYVEAEAFVGKGTLDDKTGLSTRYQAATINAFGAYLNVEVDLKPAYVGLKYAYVTGDDPDTADTIEGDVLGILTLGQDHDFALMIGNYEYFNQVTANGTAGGAGFIGRGPYGLTGYSVGYTMQNINAVQVYVGVKPTPKLDLRLAVTDAYLQSVPNTTAGYFNVNGQRNSGNGSNVCSGGQSSTLGGCVRYVSDHIGTEVDLRTSYKIFDNLTYSLNAGYLFTGDFFKGQSMDTVTSNDYVIMHQLLLSF